MEAGKPLFSVESPLSLSPSGWPVIEPGLLMTCIGRVTLVHINEKATEESQRRHVVELARLIDGQHGSMRTGVIYDIPSSQGFSAMTRRDTGEVLKSRESVVRERTSAYAMATPSAMVRGLLSAVFWLAPPPYRYAVVNTVREALEFVATYTEAMDVDFTEQEYKKLLARHAHVVLGAERPRR